MFRIEWCWHWNCVLVLNWIAQNRTVLTSKLCTLCWTELSKITLTFNSVYCPVNWGCTIHWLHLCRGVRPPPPNECPGYDIIQPDGEVPTVLEHWGMWSTLSLPLLTGPLWPGVVAPDRALSIGWIELTAYLC